MIRFEDHIEFLEELSDELAGAGDYINSDNVALVIQFLEEQKQLHVPKVCDSDGDRLRCPTCGSLIYHRIGRCVECGQKVIS